MKLQVFILPSYLSNVNHETFLEKEKKSEQTSERTWGWEFESL